MMRSIAFLSQKGGTGKTTLCIHTAVAAQQAGEEVVVIDTDPQGSATSWHANRQSSWPIVATADASQLHDVMTSARHEAMTLCVVDCAPHAGPAAVTIARAVDLVLIPVRPSAFDLAAAAQTVEIVSKANAQAAFVLSACPFRSPEIHEARAALAAYGLSVAPIAITDRRAFARAITSGRAVLEFEPEGKASIEVVDLWQWIKTRLQAHVGGRYD